MELKVEDNNGVCLPELHRKFTEICYSLSYRPLSARALCVCAVREVGEEKKETEKKRKGRKRKEKI
jgi:hypothetical protein